MHMSKVFTTLTIVSMGLGGCNSHPLAMIEDQIMEDQIMHSAEASASQPSTSQIAILTEYRIAYLRSAINSGVMIMDIEDLQVGNAINHRYKFGETLLHKVLFSTQDPAVIEQVLSWGVDVHAVDDHLNTPLHYAVDAEQNGGIIKLLLDHGADVMAQNDKQKTPLCLGLCYSACSDDII